MKITFWIYELFRFQKDGSKTLQDIVVLNDCSDNLCIGGYGNDDKYYQYDSYEGYHASGYFSDKYTEHGLKIESNRVQCDLSDIKKFICN